MTSGERACRESQMIVLKQEKLWWHTLMSTWCSHCDQVIFASIRLGSKCQRTCCLLLQLWRASRENIEDGRPFIMSVCHETVIWFGGLGLLKFNYMDYTDYWNYDISSTAEKTKQRAGLCNFIYTSGMSLWMRTKVKVVCHSRSPLRPRKLDRRGSGIRLWGWGGDIHPGPMLVSLSHHF